MVGEDALLGALSYLGVAKEAAFGVFNTAPAALDFISNTIKVQKDSTILEQVERSRTMSKRLHLSKQIGGDISWHFRPMQTADCYLLMNAFGASSVVSATATGEMTGGSAFEHIIGVGNFSGTNSSLSLCSRKGPTGTGKPWEYTGVRVNELSLEVSVDAPVVLTASVIAKDATQTSTDYEALFTSTANPILSFVDARISFATTQAGITSSAFWHVQSLSYSLANSLKNGSEARRIGSDILDVLPCGVQSHELSVTMRFDTTTAYDAMMAATRLAAEIEFLGPTMSGSAVRQSLKLQFAKLYVKDAGDPEISGPDGLLTSNVTFDVLRDESTSTGYAVRALLVNNIATI